MKSKRKVILIAGIVTLVLAAGVLAYFSREMKIDNPFSTKEYGGEIVEKFTPEKDWEPGEQITKEVTARNTGDYPLFVRVKFSEKWEREKADGEGKDTIFEMTSADSGRFFPANAANSVAGGSSVYKNLTGVTDGSWIKADDGYFYYSMRLAAGGSTSKLLDYVTFCNDAHMGTYTERLLYAQVASGTEPGDGDWTETRPAAAEGMDIYQKTVLEPDPANRGLAAAHYTLTITSEIIQADLDAAKEAGWIYTPAN